MAKYVIGVALAAVGLPISTPDILGVFYAYFARQPGGWGNDREQAKRALVLERLNPEMRAAMAAGASVNLDTRILFAARIAMLVCAAAASLTVFLFAIRLVRPVLALVASQLVLIHPLAVEAYNYAMADAPAMAFSAAAGAAVCLWAWALQDRHRRTEVGWSGVTGIAVGLACAAKMNPLVVLGQALFVTLGLMVAAGFQRDRVHALRCLIAFAGVSFAALAVFVAVNPAIWQDPSGGLLAPYVEQKLSAELQAGFLGGALGTFGEQLEVVADLTGIGLVGLGVITLFAVALLFRPDWRRKAVACWWLFSLGAVTQWLPFARGRYVLPLVIPAVLVLTLALDVSCDWWSGAEPDELTPAVDG